MRASDQATPAWVGRSAGRSGAGPHLSACPAGCRAACSRGWRGRRRGGCPAAPPLPPRSRPAAAAPPPAPSPPCSHTRSTGRCQGCCRWRVLRQAGQGRGPVTGAAQPPASALHKQPGPKMPRVYSRPHLAPLMDRATQDSPLHAPRAQLRPHLLLQLLPIIQELVVSCRQVTCMCGYRAVRNRVCRSFPAPSSRAS